VGRPLRHVGMKKVRYSGTRSCSRRRPASNRQCRGPALGRASTPASELSSLTVLVWTASSAREAASISAHARDRWRGLAAFRSQWSTSLWTESSRSGQRDPYSVYILPRPGLWPSAKRDDDTRDHHHGDLGIERRAPPCDRRDQRHDRVVGAGKDGEEPCGTAGGHSGST